jgi:hypothetical protein
MVSNSKKYDPGCSSQILDPDADFLPSRIPADKRARRKLQRAGLFVAAGGVLRC